MKKTALQHLGLRPARSGFSLVEIMVAVALLAVIVVGLLAMFYQTQRAFRSGAEQTDVLEGGRAAIEILGRELEEISVSGVDGVPNLVIQPNWARQFHQNLPDGEVRTNQLFDISFLARYNDDWRGTICGVFGTNAGVLTLTRQELSTNVLEAGRFFARQPPYATHDPRRLIDGIIHLRILPYDRDGFLMMSNQYVFTGPSLPAFLDLELGILEPKAMEQFRARGEDGAWLANQAGRVHLFRQRIPIRNAP